MGKQVEKTINPKPQKQCIGAAFFWVLTLREGVANWRWRPFRMLSFSWYWSCSHGTALFGCFLISVHFLPKYFWLICSCCSARDVALDTLYADQSFIIELHRIPNFCFFKEKNTNGKISLWIISMSTGQPWMQYKKLPILKIISLCVCVV